MSEDESVPKSVTGDYKPIITNEGKVSLWNILTSDKFKSLERKLINVFLMLAVYFLGVNSAIWTGDQLTEQAENLCNAVSEGQLQCTKFEGKVICQRTNPSNLNLTSLCNLNTNKTSDILPYKITNVTGINITGNLSQNVNITEKVEVIVTKDINYEQNTTQEIELGEKVEINVTKV